MIRQRLLVSPLAELNGKVVFDFGIVDAESEVHEGIASRLFRVRESGTEEDVGRNEVSSLNLDLIDSIARAIGRLTTTIVLVLDENSLRPGEGQRVVLDEREGRFWRTVAIEIPKGVYRTGYERAVGSVETLAVVVSELPIDIDTVLPPVVSAGDRHRWGVLVIPRRCFGYRTSSRRWLFAIPISCCRSGSYPERLTKPNGRSMS